MGIFPCPIIIKLLDDSLKLTMLFQFFKSCLPQILLGLLLNTLTRFKLDLNERTFQPLLPLKNSFTNT